MGSANITPLQGAELMKTMKYEYNECIKNNLNNDELNEQLKLKYEINLSKIRANPLGILSNVKKIQRNLPGSKSMEARPKAPSRHRSFDEVPSNSPKNKKQIIAKDFNEENGEEKDSWDSVKGQPACLLCAMVFTSVDKLTTHTKYSTIHASNLKRLEKAKFTTIIPPEPSPPKPNRQIPSDTPSSNRVLYTGSKFFWRSKHNIDFHIYLHIEAQVLEIIGYDSATQTELPRIYLEESLVSDCISHEDILQKIKVHKETNTKYLSILETSGISPTNAASNTNNSKQKILKAKSNILDIDENNEDTFDTINDNTTEERNEANNISISNFNFNPNFTSNNTVSNSDTTQELDLLLYEEEKRLMIASLIMSKLQYQKLGNINIASTPNAVISPRFLEYKLCFLDPKLQDAILPVKPQDVIAVSIPRRRHSTQAEITESFRSLNNMQMELQEITAKAEKMSNLIRQSIELFTTHHFPSSTKSQHSSPRPKSIPLDKQTLESMKKKEVRDRWRYAIHKVVLRNALDHTVEYLKHKHHEEKTH